MKNSRYLYLLTTFKILIQALRQSLTLGILKKDVEWEREG